MCALSVGIPTMCETEWYWWTAVFVNGAITGGGVMWLYMMFNPFWWLK